MKKILLAALMAVTCVVSATAMTFGLRGDVDFGTGSIAVNEEGKQKPTMQKAETMTSGSAGIWFDLPVLNLKIVSVGLRPEVEMGINQGFVAKTEDGDVKLNSTNINVPLFLDVCVNLSILRVSIGAGAYASMPLSFKDTSKTLGGQTLQAPEVGVKSITWGIAGFAQAGLKLGPGYLLVDGHLKAPITAQELKTAATGGEKGKSIVTDKTYKISVGLGYEFMF